MRNFSVSASLYVGLKAYSLDDNIAYLKDLYAAGIKRIFVSAHMPEAGDEALSELKIVIAEAKKLGIEVIVDINKKVLDKIGLIDDIYSLRLDWGFSFDDIIKLTQYDFKIELNASVINKDLLTKLKAKEVDISQFRVSHNFYPKPYTGLSQEDLLKKNELLKAYGFKIMAYLPSQAGRRPPLEEGLPTIEDHRNLDILAALSELALLGIDEVCFGDAFCDIEEIKAVLQFNLDELEIPIKVCKGISKTESEILSKFHQNRKDASRFLVRSSFRSKDRVSPFNTVERKKFSVTIDNENFLRYQGEVGIIIKDLPKDERVNVVGRALITKYLLENIKAGQKFKFRIRGYE